MAASATRPNFAKLGGAKTCTAFPESCTLQEAITNLIRQKNPHKTWSFVGEMFGLKERAAKHRLANARAYSIGELQVLLQSEDGLDYLEAIMADAEPKWWWWAKQVMTIAAIKRRRAEDEQQILKLETSAPAEFGARRRIKSAFDAHRKLKAAIDRAETTVGFRRPDKRCCNADDPRDGRGVLDRPMAQTKKPKR